jgi:hypothetical protein
MGCNDGLWWWLFELKVDGTKGCEELIVKVAEVHRLPINLIVDGADQRTDVF